MGHVAPRVSVSQITTLRSSFVDDVQAYARAGLDGIGVWELKLGEGSDAEALEALQASGLESAAAVPAVPSILPLPLLGGPEGPAERVDAYCASLERLAPFSPGGLVLLTGTAEGREADDARSTVVDGVRTIAAEAKRLGLRIGIEPYQRDGGKLWTIVSSIPETIELLRDAQLCRSEGRVVERRHRALAVECPADHDRAGRGSRRARGRSRCECDERGREHDQHESHPGTQSFHVYSFTFRGVRVQHSLKAWRARASVSSAGAAQSESG
jgi:hypothetical protein